MATPEHIVDHKGLSKEQIDLIQQFEADYNAVGAAWFVSFVVGATLADLRPSDLSIGIEPNP